MRGTPLSDGELYAVHHPAVNLVEGGEITFRAGKTDDVHYPLYLIGGQIDVGLAQKLF